MKYGSLILAFLASVSAHGAIIAAVGNADPKSVGAAFGIVPTTPRDGTRRNPFQTDTSGNTQAGLFPHLLITSSYS